jgi:hypothetical protein
MEVEYRKNSNKELFSNLESVLEIKDLQNYIPLFTKFFNISETNYNSINLNTHYRLQNLINNENILTGFLVDDKEKVHKKNVFCKFSPLLDPIKYMIGKYDNNDPNLLKLPKFKHEITNNNKTNEPNNAAYIDGFFTYLTSKLLHNLNFIHGLDFYGSFIGLKQNLLINVEDDLEYLGNSDFFYKNLSILFNFKSTIHGDFFNSHTRNYKKRLTISDNISSINLSDITDFNHLNTLFVETPDQNNDSENPKLEFEMQIEKSVTEDSECSSRTSLTQKSGSTDDNDDNDDSSFGSIESDEEACVLIKSFPVHAICLEKCDSTLDQLIVENDISEEEWGSIVIQILFMLITYQKIFNLTHNDLHTNNIMYINTDKQFLYYKYNNKYYKVPTFGRIFKIIDFGRAIYKFQGNIICSDSFYPNGDAATQYNFGPFLNKNKPRLEPNYSFDLCRLGCALYDFFVEDDEDPETLTGIYSIIVNWCYDDKDRNILYKTNGKERYPDFKLYKMIARSVHKHTPINVISTPYFDRYIWSKKNKKQKIFNIDTLPTCT